MFKVHLSQLFQISQMDISSDRDGSQLRLDFRLKYVSDTGWCYLKRLSKKLGFCFKNSTFLELSSVAVCGKV